MIIISQSQVMINWLNTEKVDPVFSVLVGIDDEYPNNNSEHSPTL